MGALGEHHGGLNRATTILFGSLLELMVDKILDLLP